MAVWHLLPAFTHTQAGITKKKKKQPPMDTQALPIRKKKGVRGEAPSSTKSMSAPVHFDPSQTHAAIQTEGRQQPEFLPASRRPSHPELLRQIFSDDDENGKHEGKTWSGGWAER